MANDDDKTTAGLSGLVAEVIERLEQPDAIDPELQQQLSSLQTVLQTRSLDASSEPIKDLGQLSDRLLQIKHAHKQGLFDERLKRAAENLRDFLQQEPPQEEPVYWKARTLLYELNDIFHIDDAINELAYSVGETVYNELQQESVKWNSNLEIDDKKRHLIREKILFCTSRGHELKRRGDTSGARKLFDWLYDFTLNKVQTDEFPCYGTLANISYHLGAVHRILERHDQAEEMYTQALNFYYERSKRRQGDLDDFFWVTRRIAMCIGLGFGWLSLTRGHLRRAENALSTARTMLARVPNNVITFYIELLYGIIKRCRAGRNEAQLKDAIDSLEVALDNFKTRHPRYAARACWELALAFNQRGDFRRADEYLNLMGVYEAQKMNPKWRTNMHVLRSRIQRNLEHFPEALSEVEAAMEWATQCEEILPRIDALMTRGELHLVRAQRTDEGDATFSAARDDFEHGLQLLQEQQRDKKDLGHSSNPKIAAVCVLRIAQCCLGQGHEAEARKFFDKWTLLQPNVEHGWVRELATDVKSELDRRSEDFSISSQDHTKWKYADRVAELRSWLLSRALQHSHNNWSDAAKLIGVERATLYQWRHSSKEPVKRARIAEKKKTIAKETAVVGIEEPPITIVTGGT